MESRELPLQLRGNRCLVPVHFHDWVVGKNGDVRRSKTHIETDRERGDTGVFSDGSKDWQEETTDVTTRVRSWVLVPCVMHLYKYVNIVNWLLFT